MVVYLVVFRVLMPTISSDLSSKERLSIISAAFSHILNSANGFGTRCGCLN